MEGGTQNIRYHLLDALRGFAVFLMVLHHAFYTLGYEFGVGAGKDLYSFFLPVQPLFVSLFLIISGICCQFSRSNLRRGLLTAAAALLLTGATLLLTLVGIEEVIWFGILHLFAVCMLCAAALLPLLRKSRRPLVPAAVFFVLFLCFYNLPNGYLGFGPLSLSLPRALYQTKWLFVFGLPSDTFASADYYPVFPYLFLYLSGVLLGLWFSRRGFPAWMKRGRVRPLCWLGRRALPVYLLHQPVIYALAWLWFLILSP